MISPQAMLMMNAVISLLLKTTLILALALIIFRFLRHHSAKASQLLGRVSLVVLWLMAGSALLPQWHLGFISAQAPFTWFDSVSRHEGFSPLSFLTPIVPNGVVDGSSATTAPLMNHASLVLLLFIWALVTLILVAKIIVDYLRVLRLQSQATPFFGEDTRKVWAQRFGFKKNHRWVLRANVDLSPMSWGWVRPVILLPHSADQWSAQRIELVLLHEANHLKNGDFLFLMWSRVTCALLWFNPLMWLFHRHLNAIREHACDESVLDQGAKPSEYADHLLDIARSLCQTPSYGCSSLSMARRSQLEGRLLAILEPAQQRATLLPLTALLFITIPIALASPFQKTLSVATHARIGNQLNEEQLAAYGISQALVDALQQRGYRNLTIANLIALQREGLNPELLEDPAMFELSLVEDRTRVCMRADSIVSSPTLAVEINGQVYFALPRCSPFLSKPGIQKAIDPVSGVIVDKASAVIGTNVTRQVFYFENIENLRAFSGTP